MTTTQDPHRPYAHLSDREVADTWRRMCDMPPRRTRAAEDLMLAAIDAAAAELSRRGYPTVVDYPR